MTEANLPMRNDGVYATIFDMFGCTHAAHSFATAVHSTETLPGGGATIYAIDRSRSRTDYCDRTGSGHVLSGARYLENPDVRDVRADLWTLYSARQNPHLSDTARAIDPDNASQIAFMAMCAQKVLASSDAPYIGAHMAAISEESRRVWPTANSIAFGFAGLCFDRLAVMAPSGAGGFEIIQLYTT